MTKESRSNIRFSVSIPVMLRFYERENLEGWGVIYDVSLGGLLIETLFPMHDRELVYLSFTLGNDYEFADVLGIAAHVSSRNGYCVAGVKFGTAKYKTQLRDGLYNILKLEK